MTNKSFHSYILSILALTSMAFASTASARDFYDFSHFQLTAPFNISQEPIRANLLANAGKEIILIGEKDSTPQLALFAFDDKEQQYKLALNVELSNSYFSFDVSDENTVGEQSLYFLASDKVVLFDPSLKQPFIDLVNVSSIYVNQNADYLKQANFVTDLNNDGLSDVILSDFRNLNIYLNQGNDSFIKQNLPINPTVEIFDGSVSYTEKPYYLIDTNFDQHKDIVIAGNGELLTFTQNNLGQFVTEPTSISVNENITSTNWWDSRGADGKNLDQSDFAHRSVDTLKDINNDAIPDLIVRFTQSSGVLDKSNDYEVYLGRDDSGKLTYLSKADTSIKSEGTLAQLDFVDLNNDDRHEVMASSFDISVSQIIGALLTGSVDQDVLIFALDSKQRYQQRISEQVQMKFSLSSGKSGAPVIKLADLDGDGAKELILSEDENQLKIFPGLKKGNILNKHSQILDIRLPNNGALITSDDLNLDGKAELIVRYASEDGADKQNRLLILEVK
ncbi:VCBS repeat-containing protein [Thalassotalea psychrophila]|uniref:VCBS repeat-containing protein n=1 Tax=Thalassotalea psychrophila TaxID=3065647 RepID=A0ABY9TQV1_9GAMM|nr:VCBS repeat-containing protein [Colwelliaceae bacterium SQ149]